MAGKLSGSRALITGATGELGVALARAFCSEGASLLLTARDEAKLRRLAESLTPAGDASVATFVCDLGAPDGPAALVEHTRRNFAAIDILINNAALLGPAGPAWENDSDAWEAAFRVNFLVPARLCRDLMPLLARSPKGASIINLSGGGATSPRPNFTSYGAAKAALVRFSETLAVEAAPLGVRVNAIAPGIMRSRMTEDLVEQGESRSGSGEFRKAREVLEQGGTDPEKPAALAVLLASDAGKEVTGKLISAAWDPWADLPLHAAELRSSDIYTLRRIVPEDRGLNWSKS